MKSQIKKHTTNSFQETQALGEVLAKEILALGPRHEAVVLGLQGDLGAGKTTFLQGFGKGLGIKEKINSPTFVVMKRFKIYDVRFKNFFHIDCYRLHSPEEILQLGFKEIISNPENIVAIEWPEKITEVLPKKMLQIVFDHSEINTRKLSMM